jgi:nucleotide-binding universal stress UspA family protein
MYSKILVPLDGSRFSEGVLPCVRPLARVAKLPVELLYVNDPTRLAPFSPPLQGEEYLQAVAASSPRRRLSARSSWENRPERSSIWRLRKPAPSLP